MADQPKVVDLREVCLPEFLFLSAATAPEMISILHALLCVALFVVLLLEDLQSLCQNLLASFVL